MVYEMYIKYYVYMLSRAYVFHIFDTDYVLFWLKTHLSKYMHS